MYTLGLYEKALPSQLTWRERMELAAEAGFDFIELSVDESDERLSRLEWNRGRIQEMNLLAMDTGVPLLSMCLSGHRKYPLGSHDPAVRARGMDIMGKAVALAADLGIRTIQLAGYDVYYEQGDENTRGWFLENLYKAAEQAAAARVTLGFETMETPFMDTVEKAMYYVDKVSSPWLQVYPDIGNLTNAAKLYGVPETEDLKKGRGHLAAVHLKDTLPGKYRDLRFGDGHVDFDACVDTAMALGVRSFVAEFWYLGEEDWKKYPGRAAAFLRKVLDKKEKKYA